LRTISTTLYSPQTISLFPTAAHPFTTSLLLLLARPPSSCRPTTIPLHNNIFHFLFFHLVHAHPQQRPPSPPPRRSDTIPDSHDKPCKPKLSPMSHRRHPPEQPNTSPAKRRRLVRPFVPKSTKPPPTHAPSASPLTLSPAIPPSFPCSPPRHPLPPPGPSARSSHHHPSPFPPLPLGTHSATDTTSQPPSLLTAAGPASPPPSPPHPPHPQAPCSTSTTNNNPKRPPSLATTPSAAHPPITHATPAPYILSSSNDLRSPKP
jgi:hypothetical protein